MKKLLTILTTATLMTIPIIGVVSCGTGTPNIVNEKQNITLSFTISEKVSVPSIDESEPINEDIALQKIIEAAKKEGSIPGSLNISDFNIGQFEIDETSTERLRDGYVVLNVKEDNQSFTGTLNIDFVLKDITTIGEGEIVAPGTGPGGDPGGPSDPEQTNMTDLTRFDTEIENLDKDEIEDFKKELIKIAQTNEEIISKGYPDKFFKQTENFKLGLAEDENFNFANFKRNTANQYAAFSLKTIKPFEDNGTFYVADFKVEINNAISNRYVISEKMLDVNFDYDHPPTIKELEKDIWDNMKEITKGTDTILFGNKIEGSDEDPLQYSQFYNFEEWDDEELLPAFFGEKNWIASNSLGSSKGNMNETIFGRAENDIRISGDVEIPRIDLDVYGHTVIEEAFVEEAYPSDERLNELDKIIWDTVSDYASTGIKNKYSKYPKLPPIKRGEFTESGQPASWKEKIKNAINDAKVDAPVTITLTAQADEVAQESLENSLAIEVTFKKQPTYTNKKIEDLRLIKGDKTEEELLEIFNTQVEKEIKTFRPYSSYSTRELDGLKNAVSTAYNNGGGWVEYEQDFPNDGEEHPVMLRAIGRISISNEIIEDDFNIDFYSVKDLNYIKGLDEEENKSQLKALSKAIFNYVIEELRAKNTLYKFEGVSSLIDDWTNDSKDNLIEILKREIDKGGETVSLETKLTSAVTQTPFKGSISLTEIHITIAPY